jgi:hypothetical protein
MLRARFDSVRYGTKMRSGNRPRDRSSPAVHIFLRCPVQFLKMRASAGSGGDAAWNSSAIPHVRQTEPSPLNLGVFPPNVGPPLYNMAPALSSEYLSGLLQAQHISEGSRRPGQPYAVAQVMPGPPQSYELLHELPPYEERYDRPPTQYLPPVRLQQQYEACSLAQQWLWTLETLSLARAVISAWEENNEAMWMRAFIAQTKWWCDGQGFSSDMMPSGGHGVKQRSNSATSENAGKMLRSNMLDQQDKWSQSWPAGTDSRSSSGVRFPHFRI